MRGLSSRAQRGICTLFLLALVIPSAATDLQCQLTRPAPKTAKDVLARHAAATGLSLRDTKPHHMVMSMSMGQSAPPGSEAKVEVFAMVPLRILMKTTMQMMGASHEMVIGFDGETGWSMSEMTGPMILPSEQARKLAKNAKLQTDPEENAKYTLRGDTTLEGRKTWVVDGVSLDSTVGKFTQYYDDESGLLVGMNVGDYKAPGKPMMEFKDYRKFGTMLVATLMVTRMPTGDSMLARVVGFDQNPIPDSVFALPAAVKALLVKKQ